MMTKDQELAWLAGLLEGEGSFGIIKNWVGGKAYRYPHIVVSMTDSDIIKRVAILFGTGVYSLKPQGTGARLPQFRASTSGGKAADWMVRLYPFMGERRKAQIDACLVEWQSRPSAEISRQVTMRRVASIRTRRENGQFETAGQ